MAVTYGAINNADLAASAYGMFGGTPDPGLVAKYTRQESQKEKMALESQKQMQLQTKMMQAEFDKMKSTADTSGQLAAQFLTAWGSSLNDIKSMYGDAASVLKSLISGESGGAIKGPNLEGLTELSNLMKQEYTSYKEQYAPLEQELLGSAREMSQAKSGLLRGIIQGKSPYMDPEAAAARAGTDASIQGELQNQAEARRLMSMGIDPSSGRFGALTRKGAIDLAGDTVRAMNLARQTEKSQGLDRSLSVVNALNPSADASLALSMRKGGADILTSAGALEQAGLNAQTQFANAESNRLATIGNLGTSYANMASGMAQNITNPLAEMAGYYTGLSGGNTGTAAIYNPMASYQAITAAPAAMQGSNELLGTQATAAKAKTQADTLAAIRNQRNYGYSW